MLAERQSRRILNPLGTPAGEEVSSMFWLVALPGLGLVVYLMHRWAKRADEIENDSAYLYENAQGPGYGSKFLNILRGRDRD